MEPIRKPVPTSANGCSSRAIGTIHSDTVPIFIHDTVLEHILEYSERDLRRETGGFLLGGLFYDERDYVEISNFLPAVDTRSRSASLTFTHDTWARMHRVVAERYPEDKVVGWHHTHPGLGVFLSSHDLFIHRNFFGQPWQVAMVVDPRECEFCFFQWQQESVVDCGFVCVTDAAKGRTSEKSLS